MEEWQPIETAPRDGDDILVCWRETNCQIVVSWDEEAAADGEQYVWATLDGNRYHREAFGYWMPLPKPPVV